MELKIGDKVSVIDDNLKGFIVQINLHTAIIEDDSTSFEYEYPLHKLVKNLSIKNLANNMLDLCKEEQYYNNETKQGKISSNVLEVDLHIESLLNHFQHLSAHEILIHQLDTAREKISLIVDKKIDKLVLIHGIGKGVLKYELIKLLKQHDFLHYRDASFKSYGSGAIEVFY